MSPPRSLRAHRAALHQAELLRTLQAIAALEGQLMARLDMDLPTLREHLYEGYPAPDERLDILLKAAVEAVDETAAAQSIS